MNRSGSLSSREVWTNEEINWSDYDLILLKAPWDYHENIIAFYNWLDLLNNLSIPILNPYEILKWNSDKHYLKEISDSGLRVIPTVFLEKNSSLQLKSVFEELNSQKLIIKPCISAGAKNTFVLTSDNITLHQKSIDDLLKHEALLVQPFINEIETEGEWSFLFFDGKYSHSVLKKPCAGDFRVQHCYGGTIHADKIEMPYIEAAQNFVDKFAKGCLYARVDGVMVNNTFLLMELELLEPFLFLSYHPKGFENYHAALVKFIAQIDPSSISSFKTEKA